MQDQWQINAGQKLHGEHSAILSSFIKLPFAIKICVLSIFEWRFYTVFTVHILFLNNRIWGDRVCCFAYVVCMTGWFNHDMYVSLGVMCCARGEPIQSTEITVMKTS